MVFQKSNPFPTMSIAENVTVGLKLNGVRQKPRLAASGWSEPCAWRPSGTKSKTGCTPTRLSLSGGQQQRLCIARALAIEPEVLLMDEPASALDPLATAKIEELILELKKQFTIVIVTHNMQQAARISDHTAFFYLGELIEFDQTHKALHQPGQQTNRRLCHRPFWLTARTDR